MKKRKFKLFTSIASLALVVAVMAVGVWAAISQTVAVTSTVAFTAEGVNVTVVGNVTNATETSEYSESVVSTEASGGLGTWAIGTLTFISTNGGIAIGDEFIYIELAITNDNAASGFALNVAIGGVTAPVVGDNVLAKFAVGTTLADVRTAAEAGTTLVTGTNVGNATTVAAKATSYLVIAIKIQNIDVSVANKSVNFSLTFTKAQA